MNITFGGPIGFLDEAKDVSKLIENQVKHVAYVRVVSNLCRDYQVTRILIISANAMACIGLCPSY